MGTVDHLRQTSAEHVIGDISKLLENEPEKHLLRVLDFAQHLVTDEGHRKAIGVLRAHIEHDGDGQLPVPMQTLARGLKQTAPRTRSRKAWERVLAQETRWLEPSG